MADGEKIVLCGSTNPVKVSACQSAFSTSFPEERFRVVGVSAASDVPDQPMGEAETRQGAMNRARSALATYRGEHGEDAAVAFSVGLEGGVCDDVVTDAKTGEEVANTLRCMAWMAVLRPSDGRWGIAHTGGFPLPHKVAQLVRGGMELGHADDQVFGRSNSKQQDGSVGLLTKGLINRAQYYDHALTLSLVPFRHGDLYP